MVIKKLNMKNYCFGDSLVKAEISVPPPVTFAPAVAAPV